MAYWGWPLKHYFSIIYYSVSFKDTHIKKSNE